MNDSVRGHNADDDTGNVTDHHQKQKDTQAMLAAVKKGDHVTTVGGIRGVIHAVKDDTVIIRVDDTVKLEFNKSAVSAVNTRGAAKADSKGDSAADSPKQPEGEAQSKDSD